MANVSLSLALIACISKKIKVLCEQTRELTDALHDFFLDYVQCYLVQGILCLVVIFRVREVVSSVR